MDESPGSHTQKPSVGGTNTNQPSHNKKDTKGGQKPKGAPKAPKQGRKAASDNLVKADLVNETQKLAGDKDAMKETISDLKTQLKERDSHTNKMKEELANLELEVQLIEAREKKEAAEAKDAAINTFSATTDIDPDQTLPPPACVPGFFGPVGCSYHKKAMTDDNTLFVTNVKAPPCLKFALSVAYIRETMFWPFVRMLLYILGFILTMWWVPTFYGLLYDLISLVYCLMYATGFQGYSVKKTGEKYLFRPFLCKIFFSLAPMLNMAFFRLMPLLWFVPLIYYSLVIWWSMILVDTCKLQLHYKRKGSYKTDINPVFDSDVRKRPPHTFRCYQPLIEVHFKSYLDDEDYYTYLNIPRGFGCIKHWQDDSSNRFREVWLLEPMLATLLNRKTNISSLYAKKQAVDRVCRLAETTSCFSEEYSRLLKTGDSTLADTALYSATLLAQDATVELQDF